MTPGTRGRGRAIALCQMAAGCIVLMLCGTASGAAVSDAEKRPSFSVTTAVREDIVLPPSELLLEITLSNISDHDIFEHGDHWRLFAIEVRDANGNAVRTTPAWDNVKQPYVMGPSVSFPIEPGGSETCQVLLNRVFDLTRPGRYTVQASRDDALSGLTVKSNAVAFTVPRPVQLHHFAPPAFSIALSAPLESITSGWQIPLSIAIKNNSPRNLLLGMWIEPDQVSDDFGAGIEVSDASGPSAQLTNKGVAFRDRNEVPDGSFILTPIRPGGTLEQICRLGSVFDVSRPGQYTIRVTLTDPRSGRAIKSNAISVTVLSPMDNRTSANPPFIVTLRTEHVPAPAKIKIPLYICRTNISERDITIDNFTYMDEIRVLDDHGEPVALIPHDKNPPSYADAMKQRPDDPPEPWRELKISPAQTVCGALGLEQIWDMEKPGVYSVQVMQHDYADRAPGQKIASMPIVKSNKVEIRVNP